MYRFQSTRLIFAAASSLFLGCGGSSATGNGDAVASDSVDTDAAPVCPLSATTCVPECMTVTGSEWDSVKSCLFVNPIVVGCWDTVNPRLADDVCLIRKSDGLVIRGQGSNRFDTAVWEPCESALAEQVTTGTSCEDIAPVECPASASECSDGCGEILAHPWSADGQCKEAYVAVGCWPLMVPKTADMKCMKRLSDGAIFESSTGSLLATKPETWGACDAATESTVSSAPTCPN